MKKDLLIAIMSFSFLACSEQRLLFSNQESKHWPTEKRSCGDRPIDPQGVELRDVVPQAQIGDSVCWAGTLAMIFQYFGDTRRQCELANEILKPPMDCCVGARLEKSSACNDGLENYKINILLSRHNLVFKYLDRALTESEIQHELSNGRPILISYNYTNDGCKELQRATHASPPAECHAHVSLIVGFRPGSIPTTPREQVLMYYTLIDPATGNAYHIDYQMLNAGITHEFVHPWRETWWHISPRLDGCVERFDPNCGCMAHAP